MIKQISNGPKLVKIISQKFPTPKKIFNEKGSLLILTICQIKKKEKKWEQPQLQKTIMWEQKIALYI